MKGFSEMIEKRYKSYKYVHCYCAKEGDILVGTKLYRFVNILFVIPASVILSVMVIMGSTTVAATTKTALVVGIILMPTLLSRVAYSNAKREMLKAGHTTACGRKIAYLTVLYNGPWSEFRIMKNKEN